MEITYLNVAQFASENLKFSSGQLFADFTKPKSFDTFSYVYLSCCLYDVYKKRSVKGIRFPQGSGYFHFNNFVWEYFPEGIKSFVLNKTVKILHEEFDIDEIEERIANIIIDNDINVPIPEVRENVSEITDNIKSHAIYPFMFMRCNYSPLDKFFDIAIGDIGLGIRNTLIKKNEYSYLASLTHREAIVKAFDARVTSKADARGLGLTMVSDYFIEEPKGILFLCSGDGYYMVNYKEVGEASSSGNLKYNIDGVQVLLRFRCKE